MPFIPWPIPRPIPKIYDCSCDAVLDQQVTTCYRVSSIDAGSFLNTQYPQLPYHRTRSCPEFHQRCAHKTCDTTLNSRSPAADSNLQAKSFQLKYLVSIRNVSQVWWNKFPTITGKDGHLTIFCESLNNRFDRTHFRKRSTPVVSRCEYDNIAAVAISCSWRAT